MNTIGQVNAVNSSDNVSAAAECDVRTLLDSACAHLMYELDVEVVHCKRIQELIEYLTTLTRLVKDRSPSAAAITEIDFVNK